MEHRCLQAAISHAAKKYGEKEFLRLVFRGENDSVHSFADFFSRSLATAEKLSHEGIRPGDLAVIVLDYSDELFFAICGAILAGAVPAVLPYPMRSSDAKAYGASLERLFSFLSPTAFITEESILEMLGEKTIDKTSIILRDSLVKCDVSNAKTENPAKARPEDTALILHSSGTTGLQKGIMLSHQAILSYIDNYPERTGVNSDDIFASWLPLHHTWGIIGHFLLPLIKGCKCVCMSTYHWIMEPEKLFAIIDKHKATFTGLSNFALSACTHRVTAEQKRKLDLSCLRGIITGSEPMHRTTIEAFVTAFADCGITPGHMMNAYGMSENTLISNLVAPGAGTHFHRLDLRELTLRNNAKFATEQDIAENNYIDILTVGKPLKGNEFKVIDENNKRLPAYRVGQIALKSNSMFSGYFQREDLTSAVLDEDGWYLSGDLGYCDKDGFFYILGRKDDMIINCGRNIYPQDIEDVVNGVSGVMRGQVVAFGCYSEEMGTQRIVVVAECTTEDKNEQQQLRGEIKRQIAGRLDILVDKVILKTKSWVEKSSSGKIARKLNRKKYLREKNS